MQSNNIQDQNITNETDYAKYLYAKGILPGPIKCSCNNTYFTIQNDGNNNTSGCCFRCQNSKCRKKYPIRINSFFSKFPYQKLGVISEIINCFLNYEYNSSKALKYLQESKHLTISKTIILKVYKELRYVIYRYLYISYQTEPLGESNKNQYFSVDESLFSHRNGKQIWILGIINNTSKEFRLEGSYKRDARTLESFIKKFVQNGNNIITDGWSGYDFLDRPNSGYIRYKHIHGGGDFGYGVQSTSHIESIWNSIKTKIKSTYGVIPKKNLIKFIREAEYKFINRMKTFNEKIVDFFQCFSFLNDVADVEFNDNLFLSDSEDSDSDDSSSEENNSLDI